MTDTARWKATVYVGGLPQQVSSTTVHDAFLPFGEIADVSLPKNENPNSTDTHRGFAYVEFEDADDAKEAVDNMDRAEFFGRVIRVSTAKPPKSANEGLHSRRAIWEQVCSHFLWHPCRCAILSHSRDTGGLARPARRRRGGPAGRRAG